MKNLLKINNLRVKAENKQILNNLDISVNSGELHIIMGPNGSGKSTLANVIMGNPKYEVVAGDILFNKKNITNAKPDERALAGLFLAFQYPRELQGIALNQFLFTAYSAQVRERKELTPFGIFDFNKKLETQASKLNIKADLIERGVNNGFSGGEKKKMEMLQIAMLEPKLAILDEIDSGVDVDALKNISSAISRFKKIGISIIIITHYARLLQYLETDAVHIMSNGKIVRSGKKDLAKEIEKFGFEKFI